MFWEEAVGPRLLVIHARQYECVRRWEDVVFAEKYTSNVKSLGTTRDRVAVTRAPLFADLDGSSI